MRAKAVIIAIIVAAAVAALVAINAGKDEKPPRPPLVAEGVAAPDITLKGTDGTPWRLSSRRGKVVLVNFWATWCDTCKGEMPSLQRLYDAKRTDPGFEMVTVLYNDELPNAVRYLRENGYTLPLYLDPGGPAARAYGLTGVPETYIVGKDGILRKKIIGPADFDSPDALGYFTRLLAEGS